MPALSFYTQHKRILSRGLLLLLLLFALLGATRQAWAQATAHFDLGCRAALTSAGGLQTAPGGAVATLGVFGQWAQGASLSANYQVHTGYLQPGVVTSSAGEAITPAQTAAASSRFLPFIQRAGRILRGCQY